jgi:anti-sigma factor RsiW
MNLATTPLSWNGCLSALRLDRWMMGELGPDDGETVSVHVAGCAACSAAVAGMRGVREEVRALPLPPRLAPPPLRRRAPLAAAGLGLAVAAGLVLMFRSEPAQRTKGTGLGLTMFVQHGGEVRRAAPGESVAPGDAVRFAVSTPSPAFVAVLSVDPAGRASIYFPEGPRAAQVAGGAEVPLPLGTRLDATTGEERLVGLFCTSPVELEPVRLALQKAPDAAPLPTDCQGLRWSFVKR